MIKEDNNENPGSLIWGRNPVIEAFRAGRTVDKLYVQEGCRDKAVLAMIGEAKKRDTLIKYVKKEQLDRLSQQGVHQGVAARISGAEYAEIDDILGLAAKKGEDPFIILLDRIEDPHNLGSIIRTADQAGAHGVIIPKNRSAALTAAAVKASAGAANYLPVARVTNLAAAIEELKERGLWFVCADTDGELMYDVNMTGPIGLVIGNEGGGVARLVREKCDMTARIPMKGHIDSLGASAACAVLAYEIARQRMQGHK